MFKFVAVLAFVAACSATYNVAPSKTYMVDLGKDYIKVANEYGKYVLFKADKYFGYEQPQYWFVEFHQEQETPKIVRFFDRKVATEGLYQTEILYKIFSEFNGQIDAVQYEKLLEILRDYVKNDQIYPTILYVLKALYGDEEALNYFYQEYYQTAYNRLGYYGKGYRHGDYERETPYNRFGFYFGKNSGYGDYDREYYNREHYNKDFYNKGLSTYYPRQYAGKGIYENYYGPYNTEYQRDQDYDRQTPYKSFGFLFGKAGYGYDRTYNYPAKYEYSSEYYRPYNREHQQFKGQYGYGYPETFYRQFPRYGYQYGKTYGLEYPQEYQGLYSQQYYGPYANQYTNLFRGYGTNFRYQKPYYF